jgi:hypothetical protein
MNRKQPQGMNVSAADILAAYIVCFGEAMNPNKPFAKGAEEIVAFCGRTNKNWQHLMRDTKEARERLMARLPANTYPDYWEVAQHVTEMHIG